MDAVTLEQIKEENRKMRAWFRDVLFWTLLHTRVPANVRLDLQAIIKKTTDKWFGAEG